MSTIDDRIVSMKFDNADFERKIAQTLSSLDKLSRSLDFTNSTRGMSELSNVASHFNLGGIGAAVDNISSKFSALGAIGFTAIQRITSGVLDFVKSSGEDVLGPIISGGKTRAQNIDQAKFQFRGLGIDVDKAMASALSAVKGTSFGLDEAAKAAAQFGASGINAGDQMTSSLRAIAGAAGITGKSFGEFADIFTSSAATGVVNNQDLQQFATRGLNAAATVAKQLNITEAQVHQMATDGKLDFKTFSDAMDKAFGKFATKASETYAGSLANVHAAMSRLGASFFGPKQIQQRDLFNALTPAIDSVNEAMQPLIKSFLGLRQVGIDKAIGFLKTIDFKPITEGFGHLGNILKNVFGLINQVITPFKEAFRDIFPKSSVSLFVTVTAAIDRFVAQLKIGGGTLNQIREVFRGFFSVIEIGWTIIKELALALTNLIPAIKIGEGGFLEIAQKVAIFLEKMDRILVTEGGIHKFFVGLVEFIKHPMDAIDQLKISLGGLLDALKDPIGFLDAHRDSMTKFFDSFKGGDAAEAVLGRVESRYKSLAGVFSTLSDAFGNVPPIPQGFKDALDKAWEVIKTWFSELGTKIAAAFKPGDFSAGADLVNVGLLAGIGVGLAKFFKLFKSFKEEGIKFDFSGIRTQVEGLLEGVKGKLSAMQNEVKADTIMKIAKAVGILAASLFVLSLIDSAKLSVALLAMGSALAQMVATMAVLDKIGGDGVKGSAKLAALGAAMVSIATSMLILSGAIAILAAIDPAKLAAGLAGMSAALAAMVLAVNNISSNPVQVLAAAFAMNGIATALVILAGAIKLFSLMSGEEIAKGLITIGLALTILVVAMNLISANPVGLLAAAASMIAISIALTILAGAVKLFSMMSVGEIAKGLIAITIALDLISVAMSLMPLTLPITAAGLLLVAIALGAMAGAVLAMGSMDFKTLAKGIGGIAALLLVLTIAMNAMSGALAGAAALIIVSASLVILAGVMKTFGDMNIGDIVKALGAIAAVLIVLGVGAALMAPIVPALLALGVALGFIGGAMALFGVGAYLVARAFQVMAVAGKAGMEGIVAALQLLLTFLPTIVDALAASIINLAKHLLEATPLLIRLLEAVFLQLLETVIKLVPKIVEALGAIITGLVKLIVDHAPEIIYAGFVILMLLLQGLNANIEEITGVVVEIIVKFLDTLTANAQKLIDAGIGFLRSFLGGIASLYQEVVDAGFKILLAIIQGVADNINLIIDTAANIIAQFITETGNKAAELATAGADALIMFITGIADNVYRVVRTATDVAIAFINAIGDNAVKFARAAADALINFLNGLADAIREKAPLIREAGRNVAGAIIEGMIGGLSASDAIRNVVDAAVDVAKAAYNAVKKFLHMASPSKLFAEIGGYMAQGMAVGLDKDKTATNSAVAQAERIVKAFQKTLAKVPLSLDGMGDLSPVISPVLDLTQVRVASKDLSDLLGNPLISPEVSYDQARLISKTADLNNAASETPTPVVQPTEVKFEQNNYSPRALSTGDIYRNTRSQIALAKEELRIP